MLYIGSGHGCFIFVSRFSSFLGWKLGNRRHAEMLSKKAILKFALQNSLENTCAKTSLLIKLHAEGKFRPTNLLKRDSGIVIFL